jgi:hypothetical protein
MNDSLKLFHMFMKTEKPNFYESSRKETIFCFNKKCTDCNLIDQCEGTPLLSKKDFGQVKITHPEYFI